MTPTEQKCNKYHHGDLRNTLILAAAELIQERGSDDFAMSEAARKAGVSSAAPYRHFKDKEDLLHAVSQLGFFSLSEQLLEISTRYEPGSSLRIVELGKCYLRFVTEHPAFFDLMWGDRGSEFIDEESLQRNTNGFWILVDAVQNWCEKEGVRGSDPLDLSLKLWSTALGLSTLAITRHMQRFVPEVDVYELLTSSTNTFLNGVKREQ